MAARCLPLNWSGLENNSGKKIEEGNDTMSRKMKVRWIATLAALLLLFSLPSGVWAEETIEPDTEYVMKTTFRKVIPSGSGFRVMQGGCVSEKYAWFALMKVGEDVTDRNRECVIVKYERESMEKAGQSEPLLLHHANDITYMSETNELYVINVYGRQVSVLDADTLTIKETKMVSDAYGLDYCPEKETFVTAMGSCDMGFYDKTLEKRTGSAVTENTTLITQGICAEENYIYHVLYSHNNEKEPQNMVWIADWEGNIVAKLPIDTWGYEPENISLVGDTFYIGCNTFFGGAVFTAKLEKLEAENEKAP